jgi:hypothetical protein
MTKLFIVLSSVLACRHVNYFDVKRFFFLLNFNLYIPFHNHCPRSVTEKEDKPSVFYSLNLLNVIGSQQVTINIH